MAGRGAGPRIFARCGLLSPLPSQKGCALSQRRARVLLESDNGVIQPGKAVPALNEGIGGDPSHRGRFVVQAGV